MSVILPGSYDPVTVGHLDIIRRVAEREEEVYVVAFINESKNYLFTESERLGMLAIATRDIPGVTVDLSHGTVVDYMREHGIGRIVKGYRDERDLEWERYQAKYNMEHGGFETELVLCREDMARISSTLVRERLAAGEDISALVPYGVADYIYSLKKDINRKETENAGKN